MTKAIRAADSAGVLGAIFAALCCAGMPLILGVLSAIGLSSFRRDSILIPLMGVSLAVALWGFLSGRRLHGSNLPIILALSGSTALVAGVVFIHGFPGTVTIAVGAITLTLRTSNHSVYAVGDVAGSYQFTHVADARARMVVRNALFFGRQRIDSLVVPWCTYTSPELAHVGMSADQLADVKGLRSITVPLTEVDRATLEGDSDGFCRLHLAENKIVAATMVADRAGDIITIVAAAMSNGLGVSALGKTIFPYPTEAEALRRAADAARRGSLTPGRQRLLRKFFGLFR